MPAPKFNRGQDLVHVKSGGRYCIIELPQPHLRMECCGEAFYTYRGYGTDHDHIIWCRRQSEMEDGRFVPPDQLSNKGHAADIILELQGRYCLLWDAAKSLSDYLWTRTGATADWPIEIKADSTAEANSLVTKLNNLRLQTQGDIPRVASSGMAARVLAMCKKRGWSLHWTARGAYLHLESSELIEAIRGKKGDPLSEAADVLLVLMSITENHGLQWHNVVERLDEIVTILETKERYKGEEYVEGGSAA